MDTMLITRGLNVMFFFSAYLLAVTSSYSLKMRAMSSWLASLRRLTVSSMRSNLPTWICLSGPTIFQNKMDMEKVFLFKSTLISLKNYMTSSSTFLLPPVTPLSQHQVCLLTCKKCTGSDMVRVRKDQHLRN